MYQGEFRIKELFPVLKRSIFGLNLTTLIMTVMGAGHKMMTVCLCKFGELIYLYLS
jgi:hypothetical protein